MQSSLVLIALFAGATASAATTVSPAPIVQGSTAGVHTGFAGLHRRALNGTTDGATNGTTNGTTSGSTNGTTSGSTNGTASGSTNGTTSGATVSGDGTYYDVGLGACENTNTDSQLVAALNAPQYDSGSLQRRAISTACGKNVCVTGPKGQVKVQIVDKCPGCAAGDLDLSPAAFNTIADAAQGRVSITWTEC